MERVLKILQRISFKVFGQEFIIHAKYDERFSRSISLDGVRKVGRIYLQVIYLAPCAKTGEVHSWKGRKWYLSDYMTNDEIVKTAFAACKAAVEHEIMEGFKVDKYTLFNPHINFEELLKISEREVKRTENALSTTELGNGIAP